MFCSLLSFSDNSTVHRPQISLEAIIELTNQGRYWYSKKIEGCCKQVREAVILPARKGEYPSKACVSDLISQLGYFRYKKVRIALRDAKSDLTFKA